MLENILSSIFLVLVIIGPILILVALFDNNNEEVMTDEEMAEQYAVENWEHYEEGQTDYKALKQAYLAGLKAGKDMNVATKWHDLRKNPKDLPLKGEKDYITNIGVMTFTSLHDRLIWTTPLCEACDYHADVTDEVIAWCEIPKWETADVEKHCNKPAS